jgi:hypothetical protein
LDLLLRIELGHIQQTVAMAILSVRFFDLFMPTGTLLGRRNRSSQESFMDAGAATADSGLARLICLLFVSRANEVFCFVPARQLAAGLPLLDDATPPGFLALF